MWKTLEKSLWLLNLIHITGITTNMGSCIVSIIRKPHNGGCWNGGKFNKNY